MTIYIKDTSVRPAQEVTFKRYDEAVRYLEQVVIRTTGMSRRQRMQELESIGHGYDDPDAIHFVQSMAEQVEIGVIREGRRMRCDITTMRYDKAEYGD
jgi:hypothetical protein